MLTVPELLEVSQAKKVFAFWGVEGAATCVGRSKVKRLRLA